MDREGQEFDRGGAGEVMLRFVFRGRKVAQGRVQAGGVIGVLQIGKKRRQEVPHGAIALLIDFLVFQCLHEALDIRVVVRIPRAGHGPCDPRFLKALPIVSR